MGRLHALRRDNENRLVDHCRDLLQQGGNFVENSNKLVDQGTQLLQETGEIANGASKVFQAVGLATQGALSCLTKNVWIVGGSAIMAGVSAVAAAGGFLWFGHTCTQKVEEMAAELREGRKQFGQNTTKITSTLDKTRKNINASLNQISGAAAQTAASVDKNLEKLTNQTGTLATGMTKVATAAAVALSSLVIFPLTRLRDSICTTHPDSIYCAGPSNNTMILAGAGGVLLATYILTQRNRLTASLYDETDPLQKAEWEATQEEWARLLKASDQALAVTKELDQHWPTPNLKQLT